ncbi:right-handed parallel beta-helix repeat-containing protein [Methanobrevibacter sp.]|uniref:right-handed parallel beta-helix repeat-containing protein n=1 Tax=Methanobrevibacter sp. TaxID=66852 RepID=UPI002E7A113B|nr:hypothetical protein [Methanobrevibacter sp.]MEE1336568.1 hypothetical protein [Methanobrevibacter sp.]
MNFKEFDNLIRSGVKKIVLKEDVILNDDEALKYSNGIVLDGDDLVIDGAGHTVDAGQKIRIFFISGNNITLKNIEFINGFDKMKGGAIYNDGGKLNILNSRFSSNRSHFGGAIFNKEGILNISESTFTGNFSKSMIASRGAAIYNEATLNISKSILSGNQGEYCGGAVYNEGDLDISDSRVLDNTAEGMGGAIFNEKYGTVNINGCELFNNCVKWFGGEIYQNRDEWFMNRPRGSNDSVEGSGGAIYNGGNFTITNSKICHNEARMWGGAIRNRGNMEISDSSLFSNTSNEWGGSIDNSSNLKIFNCKILSNESPKNIIFNEDSMQAYNTLFNANTSKHIIFNNKNSNSSIINGKFTDNHVESVIYNSGKSCIIEKSIFKNNHDSKCIINCSELALINLKISDMDTLFLNHGHVLIKRSDRTFKRNICGKGKVDFEEDLIFPTGNCDFGYLDKKIHESDNAEIILENDISFEAYEKDFYEGGIELDIDGLIINGNGNVIDGGRKSRIFIITANNITLKNITFKNGRSHKSYDNHLNECGAVLRINTNADVSVENCKFINNKSERNGGAIYNNGRLNIESCIFQSNTSKSGGAINNCGKLEIRNSIFYQNSANVKGSGGGAIYNNNAQLCMSNCQLLDNSSVYGGAILNVNALSEISDSILSVNQAKNDGGAIFNDCSQLKITNSKFYGNLTMDYGAAIYNEIGKLDIFGSEFKHHVGYSGGGVIFNNLDFQLQAEDISINESVFRDNVGRKSFFNDDYLNLVNCIIERAKR